MMNIIATRGECSRRKPSCRFYVIVPMMNVNAESVNAVPGVMI